MYLSNGQTMDVTRVNSIIKTYSLQFEGIEFYDWENKTFSRANNQEWLIACEFEGWIATNDSNAQKISNNKSPIIQVRVTQFNHIV